jgi:site-specific DNA-cytosine methylase
LTWTMGVPPVVGSVCSGYGGLDLAVAAELGGQVAWVADISPGASMILAHRYPGVPNLGDISAADWSQAGPVDVLCGGFPCTDVSAAGQRAGLKHGTRSGVWHHMARAIAELRPSLVVIENVRGLLTSRGDEPTAAHLAAEAARDACEPLLDWLYTERNIAQAKGRSRRARECSERIARVMGARKRAVARCQWHERRLVRAIGTVLGSLASLGFDAEWVLLSAAEVGAPHRRERVFILAWPAADAGGAGRGAGTERTGAGAAEDTDRAASGERGIAAPGQAAVGRPRADAGGPGGAPVAADTALRGRPEREHGDDARPAGRRGAEAPDTGRGDGAAADTSGAGRQGPGHARPHGWPVAAGPAAADAESDGRHEGRPESAGDRRGT